MGGFGVGGFAGAGAANTGAGGPADPAMAGMTPEQIQVMQMTKFMERAMESCPFRTVLAGGAGFALGGVFGLFMASMSYDTPLSTMVPYGPNKTPTPLTSLPMRQQLRIGLKDMGTRSYSSAKNFAVVGTIFAGTECCIESLRAKHDLWNGVSAGCLTGGYSPPVPAPKLRQWAVRGLLRFRRRLIII
ncbi:Tim17/Tim22/Tim23/Pmp24 family-domain-containing protein [Kalaharituber pfeilii]|nr:Tim17/Tim22/Tim23/Pmp24 family-domain-containing protein [Kalaharituber pfeilii]